MSRPAELMFARGNVPNGWNSLMSARSMQPESSRTRGNLANRQILTWERMSPIHEGKSINSDLKEPIRALLAEPWSGFGVFPPSCGIQQAERDLLSSRD